MNPALAPQNNEAAPVAVLPEPLALAQAEIHNLNQQVASLRAALQAATRNGERIADEKALIESRLAVLDQNQYLFALRFLDAGGVLELASESCAKLFEDVLREGAAGKLTVTLKVKPSETGARALVYEGAVAVTEPKREAPVSIMFVGRDGKLTRNNWGEPELPGVSGGDRSDPRDAKPYADEEVGA